MTSNPIGGYFLIEGRARPPWVDAAQLPDPFWSLSDCISALHPHIHLLAWTTKTPGQIADLSAQRFSASARIPAPASVLDAILTDYHQGHPQSLPRPPFISLVVEQGGSGAGSIRRVQMRVLGQLQTFRRLS